MKLKRWFIVVQKCSKIMHSFVAIYLSMGVFKQFGSHLTPVESPVDVGMA